MRPQGLIRRYRRTATVAIAATALLLIAVATSPPAAHAKGTSDFVNGTAKATAVVSRVAPGVGNLALALTSGVAVTDIRNDLAEAEAGAANLGLIGGTLTAEGCDGSAGALKESDLPHPTVVDNRGGDHEATDYEKTPEGLRSENFGGGKEYAKATTQPLSTASVTDVTSGVPPVFTLGGGRSSATTEVIDHKARQALATVDMDLDIAGVVSLKGMHWYAQHRTGDSPVAKAGFDIASAQAGGVPLPDDNGKALSAAMNTALAPSGISVTFPTVERFTTPADVVRVTPMRIVLKDSPAGKAALGPGLNLTREQREKLIVEISKQYCSLAGAFLVADIGLNIVSGTGFLIAEFGGAEATTAEVRYENPFGELPPLVDAPLPVSGGTPSVGTPGTPDQVITTPGGTPTTTSGDTQFQPTASVGPIVALCESVHPFKWPKCSHGAAVPLGILGVVATAAMAGLDFTYQRRRLLKADQPA